MKVLIIESDQKTIGDIIFCLELGYDRAVIHTVNDGEKVVDLIESEAPHLIIMDSSILGIKPLDLIYQIRSISPNPIIVLSGNETDIERAKGLEAGADEYVLKPFSPIELLARCRAVLRRYGKPVYQNEHSVSIDQLTINFDTREVKFSGNAIKLTKTEYELLTHLVRNNDRVVTVDEILDKVWGSKYMGDPNLVKIYIYRLRSKLESDQGHPPVILNERGVGYRLLCKN